jgi:hypothetical protein
LFEAKNGRADVAAALAAAALLPYANANRGEVDADAAIELVETGAAAFSPVWDDAATQPSKSTFGGTAFVVKADMDNRAAAEAWLSLVGSAEGPALRGARSGFVPTRAIDEPSILPATHRVFLERDQRRRRHGDRAHAHQLVRRELLAPVAAGGAAAPAGVHASTEAARQRVSLQIVFNRWIERQKNMNITQNHKGIRAELFGVTSAAGTMDPRDEAALSALSRRFRALTSLLDEHAAHEERYLTPLIERQSRPLAKFITHDHGALEAQLHRLGAAAEELPSKRRETLHRFYLGVASFTSAYLGHQAAEELEVMPALAAGYTIEELVRVNAAIMAEIPPKR